MHLGTARLRLALDTDRGVAEQELERFKVFYQEHADPKVRQRTDAQMLSAIRDNKMCYIHHADLGIIACGATFDYLNGDYREAGADRVIENGFHLQKVLQAYRAVQEYFYDRPEKEYFALHAKGNNISARTLLSAGFVSWMPPEELLLERSRVLNADGFIEADYYRLPEKAYGECARYLLEVVHNPVLSRRSREGEEVDSIEIQFQTRLMDEHLDLVKWLAESTRST